MPDNSLPDQPHTIQIEWPNEPGGIRRVSRGGRTVADVEATSEKALGLAMATIRSMAGRVADTMGRLEEGICPDEAEVSFGIRLDAEAGAFLAKAASSAQVTVTLKWKGLVSDS